MDNLLQLIVSGLATGGIYALAAIGFALLWQTSQTVNFAQGEFVMIPAFFILAAMKYLSLPFWASALLALVISLLVLGVAFKRAVVDPLLHSGFVPLVIATLGLSLFMKEGVKIFYSAEPQPFPAFDAAAKVSVFGAAVSMQSVVVLGVAVATVLALQLFVARTRTGRCMQATAQNPMVARLLGVQVDRMIQLTFLINAGLVTIASILVTPIYYASYNNGETLGMAAFIAAIVGGFNQIRGAIFGGFLLGIIDNLSAAYISAAYRSVLPLLLLVLVILFRPQGILGRVEERVL